MKILAFNNHVTLLKQFPIYVKNVINFNRKSIVWVKATSDNQKNTMSSVSKRKSVSAFLKIVTNMLKRKNALTKAAH